MALRTIDGSTAGLRTQLTREPGQASPARRDAGVTGPADTFAPGRARGVSPAPQVVKTQQDLVKARQSLGDAQQTLAQDTYLAEHGGMWALMPWNWGKLDQDQKRVDAATKTLSGLQADEQAEVQKYGAPQVETARFQIFGQQLASLEKKYGKSDAARLARQVYYNDPHWTVGSLSLPADATQLLQTGLPDKDEALMMAPNGDELDMSHVAAALDWQINPPSILGVKSPVNLEDATLVGDLAQSSINTANAYSDAKAKDPKASLAQIAKQTFQGYASTPQLLGDLDGLNLAARLARNPNAKLSDTFNQYYGGGGPLTRMTEFDANNPFMTRDAQGQPALDTAKLEAATMQFAQQMRQNEKAFKWLQGKYTNPGWAKVTDAQLAQSVPAIVAGEFAPWLAAEQPPPVAQTEPVAPVGRRGPFNRIS